MKALPSPYRNETQLSKAAADKLESLGFVVLRLQSGQARVRGGWMHGNRTGTPDRACLLSRGRIAFLEAKFGPGKASPEQLRWHNQIRRLGHIVITFWTPLEAVRGVVAAEKAP